MVEENTHKGALWLSIYYFFVKFNDFFYFFEVIKGRARDGNSKIFGNFNEFFEFIKKLK